MSRNAVWAYQRGTLWAMSLEDPNVPAPVEARIRAEMAEVLPDSANSLATAMGTADAAAIQRRFASGRRCFAAWVEGRIASYCWISRGEEEVGEMERRIRLAAGEAYIWDCATLPVFRGQRLYTAALSYLCRRLAQDGLKRLWIGTNLENRPSLLAFERAGFRPVVTMTFARLLSLYILVAAPAPDSRPEVVAAARDAMAKDGEWTLGALTVGWTRGPTPVSAVRANIRTSAARPSPHSRDEGN